VLLLLLLSVVVAGKGGEGRKWALLGLEERDISSEDPAEKGCLGGANSAEIAWSARRGRRGGATINRCPVAVAAAAAAVVVPVPGSRIRRGRRVERGAFETAGLERTGEKDSGLAWEAAVGEERSMFCSKKRMAQWAFFSLD